MTVLRGSFRVGRLTVTAVSDGVSKAPRGPQWFTGVPPEEWMPVAGVDDPDALFTVNFGGFVITGDGSVTLVDCGMGQMAVPQAPGEKPAMAGGGGLLQQLAAMGIAVGDVDRVVQTHLHGDHCGWLIGGDGEPDKVTFPNAEVFISRPEVEYWQSDAAEKNILPEYTRARIDAVSAAGQLVQFEGERELSPEIRILPAPGHTPGHVVVMVVSEGESALLLGDVAHHCVHFERHSWLQSLDVDPPTSIATRKAIVALAADRDSIVTAPHMPILTLGRMRHTETGIRYGSEPAGSSVFLRDEFHA